MKRLAFTTALVASIALAGCAAAPKRDATQDRLLGAYQALERDPSLGPLAQGERARARQALDVLAQSTGRSRESRAIVAERRLQIARAPAEAELSGRQLDQLARERDRILLDASRRDAELARLEAEKLRLQNLARMEEAQRAEQRADDALLMSEQSYAEAEQAKRLAQAQSEVAALARQEADLAGAAADSLRLQLQSMTARSDVRGQVMTLAGDAFSSGQSRLRPEARANLQRVVEFVQQHPGQSVLIEGHTDAQGGANANQVLSQRRAEAVRDALIEDGVDGSRLSAMGLGEDRPVADNSTADGRSRNRRVEIVVQGAGG